MAMRFFPYYYCHACFDHQIFSICHNRFPNDKFFFISWYKIKYTKVVSITRLKYMYSPILIRLKSDENWVPILIGFQTDENFGAIGNC